MSRTLVRDGCELIAGGASLGWLEALSTGVHRLYERIRLLSSRMTPWAVAQQLALEGVLYLPTAESFHLGALYRDLWARDALNDVVVDVIEAELGGSADVDLHLGWARRQYPECCRPAVHAPHSWHQDGACAANVVAPEPTVGLVSMVTAWIPLTDCGEHAPGLELSEGRRRERYTPEQLSDPDPKVERWRPVMRRGDVMLMSGDKLHRTHVVPTMLAARTCVELRLLSRDQPPARFADHARVPLLRACQPGIP
ncbi:MAG: phytanoyl-CoA dioxygenase family protein [Myxococcales bacterium]|nr:phytanoyl-CoA dioxygenase family protein [Myxococcales bacterium]